MKQKIFVAVLMASLSSVAIAGRYVGHTSSLLGGTAGLPGIYAACQADYGDGAIMCTSVDLHESPSIAGATIQGANYMWVRPVLIPPKIDVTAGWNFGTGGSLCTYGAGTGAAVSTSFHVTHRPCTESLPAACCR